MTAELGGPGSIPLFNQKLPTNCQAMAEYQGKRENDMKTNLIINYLPQNMTEKELYSMFVTIGPVESCRVMKDFKTGYSYGFGFVNYAKAEDASRAIGTLNGLQVQNKRLKVSFARPSGEDIKETNLYVTNLPRNITEQYLDMLFGKYGTIVQKNLLKDKVTGMPRGVAFVSAFPVFQINFKMIININKIINVPVMIVMTSLEEEVNACCTCTTLKNPTLKRILRYDRREEAQQAINALNGVIPENGTEPLSVKIAEEHGKQKAAYYAGWQAGYNQSRGIGAGATRGRGIVTHGSGGLRGAHPGTRAYLNNAGYSGIMRADKSHNRYHPIGMGGGYNMYSWN